MALLARGAAALFMGLGCVLASCSDGVVKNVGGDSGSVAAQPESPAEWGPVPEFELTDQDGQDFGLADLRGAPFVLAAIFTTCSGPCPGITIGMLGLQEALQDTDVRLVSISVDPEEDTPEVLKAYAKSYGAKLDNWSFLTGDETEIYSLLKQGLWLGVERAELEQAVLGLQVSHAALLVAVDARGRRRGWYDGQDPKAMELLLERLRFLAQEEENHG